MTTKVFICWSGQRGLRIAESLRDWLSKTVFNDDLVEARVSSGIEKGALWRVELQEQLENSDVGLLCLTPEALRSPWISYEAGMLARDLCLGPRPDGAQQVSAPRRLFTFLLGVKSSELEGPLSAFQSTDGDDSDDTHRLVHALFATLPPERGTKDLAAQLVKSWPKSWQSLNQRLAVIPSASLVEVWPGFANLFRRKTFDEPTAACLSQDWLARYNGIRDTIAALVEHRTLVTRTCRPYAVELLRDLELALDEYAMVTAQLIGRRFDVAPDGTLQFDRPGIEVACEERRARVRRLVSRLADPAQAPFFDEAAHFDTLEVFTERESLVHRMIPLVEELAEYVHALSTSDKPPMVTLKNLEEWPEPAACFKLTLAALRADLPPAEIPNARKVDVEVQFRTTNWDFDRIMYAVYLKHRLACGEASAALRETVVEFAETAVERARLRETESASSSPASKRPVTVGSASTLQLWFALDAIDALRQTEQSAELCLRIQKLADDALTFVSGLGTPHDLLREYAEVIRQRYSTRAEAQPSAARTSQRLDQPNMA
jgi:hypothetical protein